MYGWADRSLISLFLSHSLVLSIMSTNTHAHIRAFSYRYSPEHMEELAQLEKAQVHCDTFYFCYVTVGFSLCTGWCATIFFNVAGWPQTRGYHSSLSHPGHPYSIVLPLTHPPPCPLLTPVKAPPFVWTHAVTKESLEGEVRVTQPQHHACGQRRRGT